MLPAPPWTASQIEGFACYVTNLKRRGRGWTTPQEGLDARRPASGQGSSEHLSSEDERQLCQVAHGINERAARGAVNGWLARASVARVFVFLVSRVSFSFLHRSCSKVAAFHAWAKLSTP